MIRYALTIFLSAFLLFQVQPLIGKYILPWFGGVPAVWTTCMLFFQSLLLVGYAYAHGMARWLKPRTQFYTHLVVLTATVFLLPIAPSVDWKPIDSSFPITRILLLLLVSVGGPYLVLASTSPLVQSWFSRAHPGRSPYRLYALSNAGSLLGLFAYPFLVEWIWTLSVQINVWSTLYGLYLVLYGLCGIDLWREGSVEQTLQISETAVQSVTATGEQAAPSSLALFDIVLWLCLSTCGSVMLLATTNCMCQDVASVPFLWVLPLGLYLLSFIVLFGREEWYSRRWFSFLMMLTVAVELILHLYTVTLGLSLQIAFYSFVLAVVCFVCHGELVQLKPSVRHLTFYYLTMAAGGALGGILVTIVAPLLFSGYYEFNIGLAASLMLLLVMFRRDHWKSLTSEEKRKELWPLARYALVFVLLISGSAWSLSVAIVEPGDESLAHIRNFYGSQRVIRREAHNEEWSHVMMSHGNTVHGVQFDKEEKRRIPTTYYGHSSGVGLAFDLHPATSQDRSLRVGVIGLGAGTLSCYARQDDFLCFYDIDPLVVQLSREYFTFQEDAIQRGADVKVILGDARIVMERQAAKNDRQEFDILVVDAFTSDAIPLHLLTRECFDLYFQHLKPSGILAVHISNRYLDLRPVVGAAAKRRKFRLAWVFDEGGELSMDSEWVLVTHNDEFLDHPAVQQASKTWDDTLPSIELTDDYSSLFQLLR